MISMSTGNGRASPSAARRKGAGTAPDRPPHPASEFFHALASTGRGGDEGGHGWELPVGSDAGRRCRGGSPPGTAVATVDPRRGQPRPPGRDVVVEQALG